MFSGEGKENAIVRERVDERGIFSNNFGGLNTIASDVNVPYTDSPLLYNAEVDVGGKVTKRKGTKLVENKTITKTNTNGYGIMSFTTGLKYNFIIEKNDANYLISTIENDVTTVLMTRINVWNLAGSLAKPKFTRTSETEPRIIITTGVNQPVQLRWVERQEIAPSSSTSIAIPNATRLANSAVGTSLSTNTVVYVNRVRTVPNSVSYSAGTLTITFASSLTIGDVVDVVFVTWQHMVEALYLTGDRISQQVTRENSVASDQNVEIPERLRADPIYNYPGSEFQYGMYAYQSSAWNDLFTFDSALTPATATEYNFGSGARYDSTAGGQVTPAPLFVTFGAITGSTPTEVMIVRQHDLNEWFYGGVDLAGSEYKVYADDTLLTQSTTSGAASGSFRQYWLIDSTGAIATATSTASRFITWEASTNIGIEADANVYIIHTSVDYIGSTATQTVADYTDGACEPLFGVGKYFDYYNGAFPDNVTVFENRLVFSGLANNPLLVLFSEVGDTTVPGRPYRKFQIETLSSLATDAFDVNISGTIDNYINGLAVWQSSLIVFARQSIHRIFPSSASSGLSSTSATTSLIATLGLVNAYSIAQAASNVYFLTDIGVYRIVFGTDSQDFRLQEVSQKIRNLFGLTKNPDYENLSFLGYDQTTEKLYVAYPREGETDCNQYLYVFNEYSNAWTEYLSQFGFRMFHGTQYNDFNLGIGFLGAVSIANSTRLGWLKFDVDNCYLDYIESDTGDGSTTAFTYNNATGFVTHTTTDKQQIYETDLPTQGRSFRMLENTEIIDVYVELDSVQLVEGVGFVKHRNNEIYLLENPGTGSTLDIYQRCPVTDYPVTQAEYEISTPIQNHRPIHVYVDNASQEQDDDYTVSGTSTTTITFTIAPANNAVIKFGLYYPVMYRTPQLTMAELGRLKRIKHLYVYFDNTLGQDIFKVSDVNSSSSQDAEEIINKPKVRLNANISLQIENDYSGEVATDIYSFYSLVFDESLFDVMTSQGQFRRYTLFKEHLLSIGYSYAIGLWSFDESAFTLAAWQISNRIGAERHINIVNR